MIRQIKPKDLKNFVYYCQNRDPYSDFYVSKNNKRLFLNNNIKICNSVFNDCLKYGEKCFIKEDNNVIKAILLIVGYKDKLERKYLKVLAHSKDDVKDLFAYLIWQKLPPNIFIKVHKTNKYIIGYDQKNKRYTPSYALRKAGFRIIAVREKEVLLKKEDIKREYRKYSHKRN